MGNILESFRAMPSVIVTKTPELQRAKSRDDLRKDIIENSLGQEMALKNAPQAFNGHFRIPPVL